MEKLRGFRANEINAVADYAASMRPVAGYGVRLSASISGGFRADIDQGQMLAMPRPWSGEVCLDGGIIMRCGGVIGPGGIILNKAIETKVVDGVETPLPRKYCAITGMELAGFAANYASGNTIYVVVRPDLSAYQVKMQLDEDDLPYLRVAVATISDNVVEPLTHGVIFCPPVGDTDAFYRINDERVSYSRSISVCNDSRMGLRAVSLYGFESGGDYLLPWRQTLGDEPDPEAVVECDNTSVLLRCMTDDDLRLRYYRAWPFFLTADGDHDDFVTRSLGIYRMEAVDGTGGSWRVLSLYAWWAMLYELPLANDVVEGLVDIGYWQGDTLCWLSLSSLLGRYHITPSSHGGASSIYQPGYFSWDGWAGYCAVIPSTAAAGRGAWIPLEGYIENSEYYQGIAEQLDQLRAAIEDLENRWGPAHEVSLNLNDRIVAAEARYQRILNRINSINARIATLKLQNGLT